MVCMQDFGGKIESIDDYDEMLDNWGDMMEEGNFAGVLSMLEHRLPKISGVPPLDELIQRASPLTSKGCPCHRRKPLLLCVDTYQTRCTCQTVHHAFVGVSCLFAGS